MIKLPKLRTALRAALTVFYLVAGVLHLAVPHDFALIVPRFVPWPEEIVFITGLCEIAGAMGLLVPALRHAAGVGLSAYAVCVFPANINHAFNMIDAGGLPMSWWYHGPRLMFQPVLVWWALYCSEVVNWPIGSDVDNT